MYKTTYKTNKRHQNKFYRICIYNMVPFQIYYYYYAQARHYPFTRFCLKINFKIEKLLVLVMENAQQFLGFEFLTRPYESRRNFYKEDIFSCFFLSNILAYVLLYHHRGLILGVLFQRRNYFSFFLLRREPRRENAECRKANMQKQKVEIEKWKVKVEKQRKCSI